MCLAAFAINASNRWPLVLASNRDEFFDRPALPLSRWQTAAGHTIYSGRDVLAGGTWLGVTPGGRVALLTNVREGVAPVAPRSRGDLVVQWLESAKDAHEFVAAMDGALYGGFNLVMGDLTSGQWHWWSNRHVDARAIGPQPLAGGIYGLSNAALDTPWPKTAALKAALVNALEQPDQQALLQVLRVALNRTDRAAADDLPTTGVSAELEWALSSAHVSVAERNYGTRCASVLVLRAQNSTAAPAGQDWAMHFEETTYPSAAAVGQLMNTTAVCTFNLALPATR